MDNRQQNKMMKKIECFRAELYLGISAKWATKLSISIFATYKNGANFSQK